MITDSQQRLARAAWVRFSSAYNERFQLRGEASQPIPPEVERLFVTADAKAIQEFTDWHEAQAVLLWL
jgi:hypothetical protein